MIKNTLYVFRYVFLLILLLTGLTTQAQELTFHGRIVDSTTNIGINGPVTFRVEVRTPTTAGDSCIMYREDI
ncbi:MAG: hypothetical protein K2P92_03875, partial [Bdellovibrionaceae bacterium]|nr:hypothetical protein [Pseudobdellovibrionaceae bacterium]